VVAVSVLLVLLSVKKVGDKLLERRINIKSTGKLEGSEVYRTLQQVHGEGIM